MKNLFSSTFLLVFSFSGLAQWHICTIDEIDVYRHLNGEIEAVNKATVSAQTAGRVAKLK